MGTTLYRSCTCIYLLASFSACSRASYQFMAPAAYAAASLVVSPPPVVAPAPPCRLARTAPVPLPLFSAHRAAPLPTKLEQSMTNYQPFKIKKALAARRKSTHPTASAGPYFSGAEFGAIIALLLLYALLITALITAGIVLLVKLIRYFIRGRARRVAQPLAAPSTAP
jgi:hypothetical protein